MLSKILDIAQVVLAILLIIAILLQQRGSGLGSAFGGSSNVYSTKRGVDKILFNATIVILVVFFLVSLANLLV
ncbi:MAG TPA: preprotein translocase subunit SecG [Candidatus Magasanikbacteria bacterium]|nr:preprotein translocase subunit SecG [Candidatus Magasanikbacteria bacterium]